jgi:RluA family pseudouridine synthase
MVEILHQDERLLVVSKPSGVLSVPTPGASGRIVIDLLREQGVFALAVHRIDRDVSGAMLFARDEGARDALERLFRERRIDKRYFALAVGTPEPAAGEIKFRILDEGRGSARVSALGKEAVTRYRTIERLGAVTAVEVELVTGRYNQIRLHFAHAGHPLAGERKYARGQDDPLRAKRVALHSWRLSFEHPFSGARVEVEAPLPADLRALVARARADAQRTGDAAASG